MNPTKSTDDHEIKTWLALGIKSKKKGGGKKKKGHLSLVQYIYLCNVIVSLLVSQIVTSKNTYYFMCYRKKDAQENLADDTRNGVASIHTSQGW